MIDQAVERLRFLCNNIPGCLAKLTEEEFSLKLKPDAWSKKEVLGHLIDSAANNHQRFVRAQFEDAPFISYDQNKWNQASRYREMDSRHLVSFWTAYNLHLIELLTHIPSSEMQKECMIGSDRKVTVEWIVNDYVRHLEHHLKQIVEYA